MGRAFRDLGWEVVSLDITPGQHTIRADILDWNYSIFPVGHFDAIHASPPCTEYSIARTCAKTPRNLELADSLVQRTLDIIDYFKPKAFFIENPFTGMLKKRPLMQHMEPYLRRVTYVLQIWHALSKGDGHMDQLRRLLATTTALHARESVPAGRRLLAPRLGATEGAIESAPFQERRAVCHSGRSV